MRLNNLKDQGKVISNPNDRDIYEKYMREIAKFKPLSREEEHELFVEYKRTGNPRIREKLCKHNLLFVVAVAKRYAMLIPYSTITLEDLISEGNIGVIQAIEKFDPNSGNKFISYAVWWIRQTIGACIQNNFKNIRLPNNVKTFIRKMEREEGQLQQLLGRDITTQELFEAMLSKGKIKESTSTSVIDELFKMNHYETSLNKKTRVDKGSRTDEGIELIDLLTSEDNTPYQTAIEKERTKIAMDMLDKLPRKIQNYIIDYFGLNGEQPMKLVEMAEKYECSGASIKSNIDKYLRQMRRNNKAIGKHLFPTPDYEFNRTWKKHGDMENTIFAI